MQEKNQVWVKIRLRVDSLLQRCITASAVTTPTRARCES
jgi:hypothetical protein